MTNGFPLLKSMTWRGQRGIVWILFTRFLILENFENYILWIKSFVKDEKIGIDYKILVIYCTLTGLRASEAIESINLIKGDYGRLKYLDSENNILKHYGFSKIFIRKTRKAYFSVVDDNVIKIAIASNSQIYSTSKSKFYRNNIEFKLSYCRKVFATCLRNKGIKPEIINLLQGRISISVFVNHYYRPDIDEIITKRIRLVLDELMKELMNST